MIWKVSGSPKASKQSKLTLLACEGRTLIADGASQVGATGGTTLTENVLVVLPPWPSLAT